MPNVNILGAENIKLVWTLQEKRRRQLLKKNDGHGCTGEGKKLSRKVWPKPRSPDSTREDMHKYEMASGMTDNIGRVHTDNFTRRANRSPTVRVGLLTYTLRRVRPVHSYHIRMCSQWTRTVRVGLALPCECSSGRVGRVG